MYMRYLLLLLVMQAWRQAHFGQGYGFIAIGDLLCTGSETSLLKCLYDTTYYCSHSQDAGVTCSGM